MTGAFKSGRWSCYRRSLSRSSDERTSIYAIQRLKMARATSAALALCSARQAGVDAVRPHAHWWPARVTRPVLSLKRRLLHFNACRPKVLQLGAAPSTCRLSTGCSTGELQEVKLVVRLGTAPSLPS